MLVSLGCLYWALGLFHPCKQSYQSALFQHHWEPWCNSEDDSCACGGQQCPGESSYHHLPWCTYIYKNGLDKVGNHILLAIKEQKKKALIVRHCMPGVKWLPGLTPTIGPHWGEQEPCKDQIKIPIPPACARRKVSIPRCWPSAQNSVWAKPKPLAAGLMNGAVLRTASLLGGSWEAMWLLLSHWVTMSCDRINIFM
jgi:hypothetical protein